MKTNQLSIKALELIVHLGWPETERLIAQKVSVDIEIHFIDKLNACVSDELDDTVCYANLIDAIKNEIRTKEFRLLEFFSEFLYQFVKNRLSEKETVKVSVTKFPTIPGLIGGIRFVRGDE